MLASILHKRVSALLNQVACSKAMPAQPGQVLLTAAGIPADGEQSAPTQVTFHSKQHPLGCQGKILWKNKNPTSIKAV